MNVYVDFPVPKSLEELIQCVIERCPEGGDRADFLLNGVMKPCHFWPALQMKKFRDDSGLVLVHNTYKRADVDWFADLYNECRSVVLNLNAPVGQNVVISLAHKIPVRLTDTAYEAAMEVETDVAEMSYEGTVVTVYNYDGKWYFGTTSCPSVNSSKYGHPTKTHGDMMDEAIAQMGLTRESFVEKLDATKAYSFIIVHHENRQHSDATEDFGENYAVLVLIGMRDRATNAELDGLARECDAVFSLGVKRAHVFADGPKEALAYIRAHPKCFGAIIKRGPSEIFKVSVDAVIQREESNLGNANPWYNMLWVYNQNKPHYRIKDYIAEYAPTVELPKDSAGREVDPTYLMHTVVCTMRDILYHLYMMTTVYYPQYRRFKMNRELDGCLFKMLRFHLAEFRNLQVKFNFYNSPTDMNRVFRAMKDYLCTHQTMKNVRGLIRFFAKYDATMPQQFYTMTARQAECFRILDALLKD